MSQVEQRIPAGLLIASLMAVACASVMLASFQYVVVDMQAAFGFSSDSANALTFMPLAASLTVVFIAGSLADRWGPRRILLIAVSAFTTGAALVAVAPSLEVVVVGRVLDGIGGVMMAIVAVSVINASVTEPRQRARVFGWYAAVTPIAYTVAPPMAALLVEYAGWRAGMIPGITLGVLALLTTMRFLPTDPTSEATGTGPQRAATELLTPTLAGLVLAGLGLGVTSIPVSRALAVIAAAIALAALIALVAALQRIRRPSLNLGWCRRAGIPLIMAAIVVGNMPNLFFYTNLLLQYRYGASLIVIALLLIITQVSAATGSLLSGAVSARIGPAQAATAALFITATLRLATLVVTPAMPIWVPVVALAISAAPAAFVVGPITNALLSHTPPNDSGAGASVNKATWTVGSVLGGAVIGSITFSAFQARLSDILNVDGLPTGQATLIAEQIRNGASTATVAENVVQPLARDDLLVGGPGLIEAQTYAYGVMGVTSAALTFAAGILMVVYVRRQAVAR